MLITKASEYAILSLIVLSKAFLAKILQALAKEGILKSYKGANGGFMLERSPEEIDILSIIHSVEGKNPSVFECSDFGQCLISCKRTSITFWQNSHSKIF